MTTYSLIVCTYKRYDLVKNSLRYIARLRVPEGVTHEVIVVENTPERDRVPMDWVDNYQNVRLIKEDVAGLSSARNAGIRAARGQVICFLDDDAQVHENWLIGLHQCYKDNADALVVGGKVVPKYPDDIKPHWVGRKCEELLSCIDWGTTTRQLKMGQWLVGANVSYRADVFEKFGLFGTSLGRKGESSLLSNEESELNSRLPETTLLYCGQAVVDHLIPQERLVQDWFRKRVFWQAVSDVMAGNVDRDMAAHHFKDYRNGMLNIPAEYRSAQALFYTSYEEKDFETQLDQIYRQTISFATGNCTWPVAV